MRRIYLDKNECTIFQGKMELSGETLHYLKDVLRAKKGYVFIGFDGSGKEYTLKVTNVGVSSIDVEILKYEEKFDVETSFDIILFQAIPKGKKMDEIIESTTQIGVKKIYPVITRRTIFDIKEDKVRNKINRWKKKAEQASKLSGRTLIPEIENFINFEDAIKIKKDIGIVFWEGESRKLREVIKNLKFPLKNKKINIFIGPEGGFDEEEINLARENNFLIASFGKRILKVEIASCVATALVIYEFENN